MILEHPPDFVFNKNGTVFFPLLGMPAVNLPFESAIAIKARAIILADLRVYDSVSLLAENAGTTPIH